MLIILVCQNSAKSLHRERKMLSKLMRKMFSKKDRENLYKKWGVNLKTKRRKLQICRQLWTESTNMEHIKESASIVAKLLGFKEPGHAPKEMFGLSLSMKPIKGKSFNWRHSLHSRTWKLRALISILYEVINGLAFCSFLTKTLCVIWWIVGAKRYESFRILCDYFIDDVDNI